MTKLSGIVIESHRTGRPKQSHLGCDGEVERDKLEAKYRELISVNRDLSRQLVSFQANKKTPFYRWFKYKEGFSRELVQYTLDTLVTSKGRLLDPFAGTGTALFTAAERGWSGTGIELLPAAAYSICARLSALKVDTTLFARAVQRIRDGHWMSVKVNKPRFHHVSITEGAFPRENEVELNAYIAFCKGRVRDVNVRNLLLFAAFTVLEDISYTRKDGQYLRWDSRAGRRNGNSTFSKGSIATFRVAIDRQLSNMLSDLTDGSEASISRPDLRGVELDKVSTVEWYEDSSLIKLCELPSESYDLVLTSPPYCNRYDYTRTYALELAFLGCGAESIKRIRQEMLSCTVENR